MQTAGATEDGYFSHRTQPSAWLTLELARTAIIRIVEVCSGQDAGDLQHEYSRYITLSYRWTAEIGRTNLKTENKAKFEQSIPTND